MGLHVPPWVGVHPRSEKPLWSCPFLLHWPVHRDAGGEGLGGGVLANQLLCLSGVPQSERATVHKNPTFSLASTEGFLVASEWAKANKVGGQRVGL